MATDDDDEDNDDDDDDDNNLSLNQKWYQKNDNEWKPTQLTKAIKENQRKPRKQPIKTTEDHWR